MYTILYLFLRDNTTNTTKKIYIYIYNIFTDVFAVIFGQKGVNQSKVANTVFS